MPITVYILFQVIQYRGYQFILNIISIYLAHFVGRLRSSSPFYKMLFSCIGIFVFCYPTNRELSKPLASRNILHVNVVAPGRVLSERKK
jgi:hypothetical protein